MHPRSVLVTGGSLRLGAHIARAFAQAGWNVWCHYHQSAEAAHTLCAELAGLGVRATPIGCDLGDPAARQAMMAAIVAAQGPLHCLVNNASTFEPDDAHTLDAAATAHQLAVNLLAPLELSSLLAQSLPAPARRGAHSVVHVLDQKVFNLNPD